MKETNGLLISEISREILRLKKAKKALESADEKICKKALEVFEDPREAALWLTSEMLMTRSYKQLPPTVNGKRALIMLSSIEHGTFT